MIFPRLYVPEGHRDTREIFGEFISDRYIASVQRYWEAYARIDRGKWGPVTSVLMLAAEGMPSATEEMWRGKIERRFKNAFFRVEVGIHDRAEADLYRDHLRDLRSIEAIQKVTEDRDVPPSDVYLCLELLVARPQGYWEQNRFDLMADFRREFISGKRKAFALADDGSMPAIAPEWWRGLQATEAMESLEFRHPEGFIVERALSPHEENRPEHRAAAALQWLRDHGERVKDLPDERRMQLFQEESDVRISPEGWRNAKARFLSEQPGMKRAFTRSGPRRKHSSP